ncbi:DNA-methyltransferase [Agrobacterium larrymoorei]|uniref:DNA-methyltransferase n=1 Tax=Agrobacterium larrymoorei TaxID=160699 RepID=UPI0030BC3969
MSHQIRDILNGRCLVHVGDCIEVMRSMPANSVDCVVTSPPYWGLRDYGVEGQIGLEPTLAEHLQVMVAVFEEVRRILKPTGTCWVNYGDCYATTPNGRSAADTKATGNDDRTFRDKPFSTIQGVLKAKDLCMVPNRFAIALQEAGWWVRSEIIWAKPNPMPESIRDRPATSHEKIFMLTKSPRYFYDKDAVRQNMAASSVSRLSQDIENQTGSTRANGGRKTNGNMKAVGGTGVGWRYQEDGSREKRVKKRGHEREHEGFRDKWDDMTKAEQQANGRNLRNYEPAPIEAWNIATQPFSDAHFATFPPELAERCIMAGCPKGGTVLDPFGGAGTTALVALRHGRSAQLIELNPEYADITCRRIEKEWKVQRQPKQVDHGPLFAGSAA